jgi:hypothetical protein
MARPWQHQGHFMVAALTRLTLGFVLLCGSRAAARSTDDPILLVWTEGDVAGFSTIYAVDGPQIGVIEYHQHRRDDVLSAVRIAHFGDGSSDEDRAEARVGKTLEAISGRSIVRDQNGKVLVDLVIDVAGGRLTGSYGDATNQTPFDETVQLSPATYWGPLIFLVLKNFDANAERGEVRFRTIAPTPKPMVLDMELREVDRRVSFERQGAKLDALAYQLRPNIHWSIDPLVHLVAPETRFLVIPGEPPALARFVGPRNYDRQTIRIE